MKKVLIITVLLFLFVTLAYSVTIHKILENGMEIVAKENHGNKSIAFYCFVKTGSINEGDYLGAGISHYLEHVVAGGSTLYHTEEEYQAMAKEMGALVNAYTSYEATAFYITVDKQYADNALEILSQQMFSCAFDSMEVAREKQVILKEIVMRSSPPRSKIYQRNNELVFPTSNRRYPVIGYTDLFKTITREQLQDYYQKRYVPNNMIFVAAGDFDANDMISKLEDTFNEFQRGQLNPIYLPPQNIRPGSIEYTEEFQIQQPMVFMTTILPSAYYEYQPELIVALDFLFGKRQSPIKYKLVEELQLVNFIYGGVSTSMRLPEGTISIIFEAKDPTKIKEIVNIIDEEIEWYSNIGIEQEDIDNLINRFKAGLVLRIPSVGSDCNSVGWNLMNYGVTNSDELWIQELEETTPQNVMNSLKKFLVPKNRVVFYAVPEGAKEMITEGSNIIIEKSEPEKIQISKDLTLIYKQNTEKPIISGVIYMPITENYETVETVGSLSFMTNLLLRGSKQYNSLDLSEWLEDHAIDIDISVNRDGTYLEFRCLKADFNKLQDIIIDAINNPTFPENEVTLAKERAKAQYQRSLSNPSSLHAEFRNENLYPGQPAGLSAEEKLAIKLALSREDLNALHKKYFNADSAIVTFFGDLTLEEAQEYAQKFYKNIPNNVVEVDETYLKVPDIDETFVQEYEFEPVNVDINCIAPVHDPNNKDFWTMKVIMAILNGSRGRIHKAVRGVNDLAYYGFARYSSGAHYGFFRLSSQTSIDKKDDLIAVLKEQIELLKNEPVTEDEIQSSIDDYYQMILTDIDDNQLPYYMTYYESIGLGYDYLNKIKDYLTGITPEDIQRVANTYFQKVAVIISEPNEEVKLMVD
ncbi:MAG TPA: insulinase family protein [Candidatus Cloacimonetes bacterium]|nr:insulinase family protein [Candidatus Cloacimonadota bacterium]HEX38039.1 insulinase family protein [Candidatus Cloacimonadota bacterium]